jgi:hypothetical protein
MRKLLLSVAVCSVTLLLSCKQEMTNPLLTESTVRYGAPAFDKITEDHYIPAFDAAIADVIASAAKLGVQDVRFLDLCDGGFYEQKELVEKIAQVVGDFRPDVILTPDPNVTSECHADHRNVGAAARQVAYFAPYSGIMAGYGAKAAPVQALAYFMTAKPNRFVKTKGYFDLQQKAIFDCHRSQFPENSEEGKSIGLYLKLRSVDFGLRSGCLCAEGFRVLGVTHMHCFPEAGN